jgi:hypothetical protein
MPQVNTPSTTRSRAIDPQMRPLRWAGKAHTRDGRMFLALRAELVRHSGGTPNAVQRALIDRLAWLQLHLAKMDERMLQSGELSDHAGKQYLAWSNSTARMLVQLGLDAAPVRQPNVQEILAQRRAAGTPPISQTEADAARAERMRVRAEQIQAAALREGRSA